jgi:hypothetical protein
MGSGACARGFRTPRSRESLEGSLPAHYEAQGQCPFQVGHRGLKTPQWSAVRRAGFARPAPASRGAGIPGAPYGALLPLLGAKTRSRAFGERNKDAPSGAKSKIESEARAVFPQRERRSMPRRSGTPVRRPGMRPTKKSNLGCLTIEPESGGPPSRVRLDHLIRPPAGERLVGIAQDADTECAEDDRCRK